MNGEKYNKKKIIIASLAVLIILIAINGASEYYYQKLDECHNSGKIEKEKYERGLAVPMIILWGAYVVYRIYVHKTTEKK